MTGFAFRRPRLADRLADSLLGFDPFGGVPSGLFLAAPRRTGKSTFLKGDLIPELEARGAFPIYIDLWADRDRDPASLIEDAIKAAVRVGEHGLAKLARRSGLSKVGIGSWVSLDVDKIGVPGGATLADALAYLIERTGRAVVLIVDEAQHAITSAAGSDAMFALKSARDTINIAGAPVAGAHVRLGLVFTGSNRDKLASLVVSKNQPFFGSSVTAFPLLGRDYTDAYTAFVNERLARDRQLDPEEVYEAFGIASFRPQVLQKAVQEHVTGPLGDVVDPDATLRDRALAAREDYWSEFDGIFAGLTPLQQAVLARLVERGDAFRPFEAESLSAYASASGQDVVAADAQSALDALREKGVVMRLERGRYTLDDISMIEWFESRMGAGGKNEDDEVSTVPGGPG